MNETLIARDIAAEPEQLVVARRRSPAQRLAGFARRNPLTVFGLAVVVLWIAVAILAPLVAPYGPLQQDIVHRLESPEGGHLFGTDDLGRDVFSRVLHGAQISLPIGALLVAIGGAFGTLIGTVAGYAGGIVDETLMRLTDLIFAFPTIILAMAVAAALGPSLEHSILAIVVVWWPSYARLARSMVLTVGQEEYVTAARSLGLGRTDHRAGDAGRRERDPDLFGPLLPGPGLDAAHARMGLDGLDGRTGARPVVAGCVPRLGHLDGCPGVQSFR